MQAQRDGMDGADVLGDVLAGFAVAASGLDLPSPIASLLTLLRSAAAPCALFALGVGLAVTMGRDVE